ncbi:MAG: hypothetical protein IJZ82_02310 [Lachnospiraceae bacterium]|nr:hypothetical protein [Lachnospiraceae bacterium]
MENTQKKMNPIWLCLLIAVLGVGLVLSGILGISKYYQEAAAAKENTEVLWFDLYSPSEEPQMLEFLFISEPFAEYTYGTSQGFYLVYDEDMFGYIICMENDRLEGEFLENYNYTYQDIEKVPELGYVEGYAVEIDEELQEYAIEFFNMFWDEELLDETNFADYLGTYYLDTTMEPATEDNSISASVVMIIVGLLLIVVAIVKVLNRGKEQKEQSAEEKVSETASNDSSNPAMENSEAFANSTTSEATYSSSPEVETQGNLVIALVASLLCACAGGVLWVLIYRLGYIAGITGCVAAVAALFGYEKIGKRQVTGGAIVWCILVSLVVLLLGNAVAYAWEFTEALSVGSPGRAEFFVVLKQLPTILKDYDCVGSFFGDWGMGVFFAAISGFSIGSRKK